MSDSALVQIGYGIQTARGTPFTGDFTAIPVNSDSLSSSTQTVQSARRSTSRIAGATVLTGTSSSGELTTEFSEEIFDDFLRSGFGADWNTAGAGEDTLSLGTDFIYMTIAKYYPYLPTDPNFTGGQSGVYEVYQDCIVTSLGLTLADQQIVAFTVGIAGGDVTSPNHPATPWNSLLPAANKSSLVVCNSLTNVLIGGNEVVSPVSQVTWNLTNTVRPQRDVRSCPDVGQTVGQATVDGSVDALHTPESSQWFYQALTNTSSSVEFRVTGETKTYRFEQPTVANAAGSPDSSGDDVTTSFPYSAFNVSPVIHRSK